MTLLPPLSGSSAEHNGLLRRCVGMRLVAATGVPVRDAQDWAHILAILEGLDNFELRFQGTDVLDEQGLGALPLVAETSTTAERLGALGDVHLLSMCSACGSYADCLMLLQSGQVHQAMCPFTTDVIDTPDSSFSKSSCTN